MRHMRLRAQPGLSCAACALRRQQLRQVVPSRRCCGGCERAPWRTRTRPSVFLLHRRRAADGRALVQHPLAHAPDNCCLPQSRIRITLLYLWHALHLSLLHRWADVAGRLLAEPSVRALDLNGGHRRCVARQGGGRPNQGERAAARHRILPAPAVAHAAHGMPMQMCRNALTFTRRARRHTLPRRCAAGVRVMIVASVRRSSALSPRRSAGSVRRRGTPPRRAASNGRRSLLASS